MNVYYSDKPVAVNDLRPLPLPAALESYAQDLMDLTRDRGYVFAKVDYLAKAWKMKPWKVYYTIKKLCSLQHFVSCRALYVRGEWRIWPAAALLKQNKAAEARPAPAPRKSWDDLPPERQELIRALVAKGVDEVAARRMIEPYKTAVARPSILAFCQWVERKDITDKQHLKRSAEKALRESWPPEEVAPAPRVITAPTPAPALPAARPAPQKRLGAPAPPPPEPEPLEPVNRGAEWERIRAIMKGEFGHDPDDPAPPGPGDTPQ